MNTSESTWLWQGRSMPSRVRDTLIRQLADGMYEPTGKRVRLVRGDQTVVDSTRAMLVWEPRRVVPSYAFPIDDVQAELAPVAAVAGGASEDDGFRPDDPALADLVLLHPGIPFRVHTFEGEPLTVRAGGEAAEAAAFRPSVPELADYVILDFSAFEEWYEEDERITGHPRDPFHRIDILRSSRRIRIVHDGQVLAESSRPFLLFETGLPVRFYLPPEDVRDELLQPSPTRSYCAYKGEASYWSLEKDGHVLPDVAWSYEQPLREAAEVRGRIAFFNERVDVVVDGHQTPRPRTPWS